MIIKVMARLKQILIGCLATIVILFLALKVTKNGDERIAWNSRGLLRGEPSGERTDYPSVWNETLPGSGSGAGYSALGTAAAFSEDYSTPSTEQDVIEKMSSIKVSVTVPSVGKYMQRLDQNITRYQENLLGIYRERKTLISKTCRKYGLGRFGHEQIQKGLEEQATYLQEMESMHPSPVQNSLMWEQKWHMLYCWVHKVASSTWSQLFFNLHGKKVPVSRLHEAAQYFHPQKNQVSPAVTNSLVFTFVRHPFERLVSAYRDKFEFAKKYSYVYSLYAGKILGINKLKERLHIKDSKSMSVLHGQRPTFVQFVDYLLGEEVQNYNDHWVPYWLHCHLCEMEYDIIGKMDTWAQDAQFITDVTGLSTTNVTLSWTNRRSNQSSNVVALQYFSQLDRATTVKLYNIYRIDFEMFGYSVQPYLDLFKSTP